MLTWSERSIALKEAVHALLTSAVLTANDPDKGAALLNANAARVDRVAAALEQDLIAHARTSSQAARPVPTQLIRALADAEDRSLAP